MKLEVQPVKKTLKFEVTQKTFAGKALPASEAPVTQGTPMFTVTDKSFAGQQLKSNMAEPVNKVSDFPKFEVTEKSFAG